MLITPEIVVLTRKVTSKYGFRQCRQCATELRMVFMAKGLHGHVLQLTTSGGRGFIVMKNPAFRLPFPMPLGIDSITETGQHFGVQVGQYVFDNIFKEGILKMQWESQFDCDAHRFTINIIEPF